MDVADDDDLARQRGAKLFGELGRIGQEPLPDAVVAEVHDVRIGERRAGPRHLAGASQPEQGKTSWRGPQQAPIVG